MVSCVKMLCEHVICHHRCRLSSTGKQCSAQTRKEGIITHILQEMSSLTLHPDTIHYCGLAVHAINLDADHVIQYILQHVEPTKFIFPPFTLLFCMQTRAEKCFRILFEHCTQSTPHSGFAEQLCQWIYQHDPQVAATFVQIILDVGRKRIASSLDAKELHAKTLQSICACRRRSFLATVLNDSTLESLGDESIPEIVMIRHMRYRAKFGDDYIEPLTQCAIEDLDPHLLWPSQDGRRLYHLPTLLEFLQGHDSSSSSQCLDPVTRHPLTVQYKITCQMEAKRIIRIHQAFALPNE